jgi:hypothetical protein
MIFLSASSYWRSEKKISFLVLGVILIFYLFNGIRYLNSQSLTSDEGAFYNYAKRLIKGNPERIDPVIDNSKTPVIVLNLLPRIAEQWIHPGTHKTDMGKEDIMWGRYITLIVSLLVILMVYYWAKDLYGTAAGLFAAFLMSFSPNNLALAGLVTTDAYSVLFLLSPFYFMWIMIRKGSLKYFILFSLTTAMAQLTKQSLFYLYVLIPVSLLIYFLINRPTFRFITGLKYLLFFILIQWFVINLGYYFYGTNRNLGDYHFMSRFFQSIQKTFPSRLPIPFPTPFVDGLDMTKYYDQLGGGFDPASSFGKVTILNHSSIGGSFWYYYFVSIFFKTPIAYFMLMCWAMALLIRRKNLRLFIQREFFLIIPICFFLVIMSFMYNTQVGIRHLIFLTPFVCILCSSVIPAAKANYKKILLGFASMYLTVSVLYYWRNYYPYTNEFIWDKTFAYKYVGASNLEFHQGAYFAADYLHNHPSVQWVSETPKTGDFLIRVDDYLDIWSRHQYDWITGIRPFGQVGFDNLLINVEPADLAPINQFLIPSTNHLPVH